MRRFMKSIRFTISLPAIFGGLLVAFIPQVASGEVGSDCADYLTYHGSEASESVYQFGMSGDDIQHAELAGGNDTIRQHGAYGDDEMHADGGYGDDVIIQFGKEGNDTIVANGSFGNDKIRLEGGYGEDSITCNVSDGKDKIEIDGGHGLDNVTINCSSCHNFTINDAAGNVIFKQGTGGSTITIYDAEKLFVLSDGIVQLYP